MWDSTPTRMKMLTPDHNPVRQGRRIVVGLKR